MSAGAKQDGQVTPRAVLALGALFLVLVSVRLAVTPSYIAGYTVLDDFNIAVQVTGGHPTWRAVTTLTETRTTVTIAISEASLQLGPGFDDQIAYIAVRLASPLDNRTLLDAASGQPIPRLTR